MNNDLLKFRVWDKKHRTYEHDSAGAYFIDMLGDLIFIKEEDDNEDRVQGENFMVERCTGQTDMEGRLIYENDIVNVYRPMMDAYEKAVVIWADYESCWVCKWLKPAEVKKDCWHSPDSGTYFQGSHCRVVGNIHEMEVSQ